MIDYLTTQDASSKRCPFKVTPTGSMWNCSTSSCMAWRWATIDDPSFKGHSMQPVPQVKSDKGYCGLPKS